MIAEQRHAPPVVGNEALRNLVAIEEIRQLQFRFWCACDIDALTGRTHNFDVVAALFTSDGSWSVSRRSAAGIEVLTRAQGTDQIRSTFRGYQEQVPYAFHHGATPLIEVDGDRATGRWKTWVVLGYDASDPQFTGGIYDLEYRRGPDGWRIQRCDVSAEFYISGREGWGSGAPYVLECGSPHPARCE